MVHVTSCPVLSQILFKSFDACLKKKRKLHFIFTSASKENQKLRVTSQFSVKRQRFWATTLCKAQTSLSTFQSFFVSDKSLRPWILRKLFAYRLYSFLLPTLQIRYLNQHFWLLVRLINTALCISHGCSHMYRLRTCLKRS